MPDILRVVTLLPPVENATQAIEISWTELGADADWDRWHELLDIRDNRGLNAEEQTEYDRLAIIAARLDQQEELATAYAVSSLEDRHQQVIASIERLVEAVREVGHQE